MSSEQKIIEWIGQNLWQIVLIASIFIQITPIKVNPWSAIFKWIGKQLLGDTKKEISHLFRDTPRIQIQDSQTCLLSHNAIFWSTNKDISKRPWSIKCTQMFPEDQRV